MSDTYSDSDDSSLTDWSLVDKHECLDESDSLSIASSIEILDDDEEEEEEDKEETATPIQGISPIRVGPIFVLRLSSRESVKRYRKSEVDATPMTSSITKSAASIEICSLSSSDFRELQQNPTTMINETASPTTRSSSLEYIRGDNSFHADDPYEFEEILTSTDGTNEGQDGRETVDPVETAAIESVGSKDERQKNLPDFQALIPKIVSKTGDEVMSLTMMTLETEFKMGSPSEIKTESDMESATVMDMEPRIKAENLILTKDITEAQREIRTECVNKTKIEQQTEAKNKTTNIHISLNMLREITKMWSWLLGYLSDNLAELTLGMLTFFLAFTVGISIGFLVAIEQLKVKEEYKIRASLIHNDLPKSYEETGKDKLIAIPPSDIQLHSDSKAIPELELQKEVKPDSLLQSKYDCLLADRPSPILVKELSSPETEFCFLPNDRVKCQSSHLEMKNTKSEPFVQDLVQTDELKNPDVFLDTDLTELDTFDNYDKMVVDFPKSQIAAVKEYNEKNETNNVHGSDENINVIVEVDDDDNGVDTEVDEDNIEDSTDLSEDEEDNHEDNYNFDDYVDEIYVDEDDYVEEYDSTYDYKPNPRKAHIDPKGDSFEDQQTERKLHNDHKSGFDPLDSYNPDSKDAKLKSETGGRQEEESLRYDKRVNSEGPSGKRENKWMDTMLDMWNKTRASVTNVTKQIQETWQQVKNLSVDLWGKNQPYVEKLQQKFGDTVEKASQSLQKKFQKATQKIQKVTRKWFGIKDNDAHVAKGDSFEKEDEIHLGPVKTTRRPFKEEVKKDGGPNTTKQEKKGDQTDQPPHETAHAKKPKPDRNHFEKMEKDLPQHKHYTKFNKDHASYGDSQKGRRHDTAQEHCGGHSKHVENKFKRACKKNVHMLFREVNNVNRIYLSTSMNLNAGNQIFESFTKFKDQFGLEVLTDEIRIWFKCQSDFWEILGAWFYGDQNHDSLQRIRDEKCIQYLKCWQIEELDPSYFIAQKCQMRNFRRRMKKLLKDPCADYQSGEYGRAVNPKWVSKPIDKPQMPHSMKDGNYSGNKREKKRTDLHRVRNLQRKKVNKDPSDSMYDEKKNLNVGDWYLQLASKREYLRTKADNWYLRRLERTNENLEAEHNVKQKSDWLFERAAEREILRAVDEYIKNLDE
ncbi:hypothetical protein CHS0354_014349 [Potamilus streckersoni]|uniref:Uncharacterized protein n=1 Tax=Potamilus streckersoni TaxID=2493646 RepID=A0AAE0VXK4_9BIVA|nr:hypothetical protein CHS0354_014349 [Potamilus streckersoni]